MQMKHKTYLHTCSSTQGMSHVTLHKIEAFVPRSSQTLAAVNQKGSFSNSEIAAFTWCLTIRTGDGTTVTDTREFQILIIQKSM